MRGIELQQVMWLLSSIIIKSNNWKPPWFNDETDNQKIPMTTWVMMANRNSNAWNRILKDNISLKAWSQWSSSLNRWSIMSVLKCASSPCSNPFTTYEKEIYWSTNKNGIPFHDRERITNFWKDHEKRTEIGKHSK